MRCYVPPPLSEASRTPFPSLFFLEHFYHTVGRVNFVRKKFRHIRNYYTNEKIERINLRTCALKTNFFPRPVSVEAQRQVVRWTSYFERDTCVHGYHECKAIWAAAVGEELECMDLSF